MGLYNLEEVGFQDRSALAVYWSIISHFLWGCSVLTSSALACSQVIWFQIVCFYGTMLVVAVWFY